MELRVRARERGTELLSEAVEKAESYSGPKLRLRSGGWAS